MDSRRNFRSYDGIRRHMLEQPVMIGGIEFSHNFFITHSDLGNKDMVLGQPWLFSHSTRIDYIHEMGVMLQLWENGDRKWQSILINLPLIKAPWKVMLIRLCCGCESYSASYDSSLEAGLVCLGMNP